MMDEHQELFKEEAYELLGVLESSLLELEETPDDEELIAKVFRAMHTIKGSGAMFGFDDISEFTHEIETAYDKIRNGHTRVSKEIISLTLQAKDLIKLMLDSPSGEAQVDPAIAEEIISTFKQLTLPKNKEVRNPPVAPLADWASPPPSSLHSSETITTYHIRFTPNRELFISGTNPLLLLDELRALGVCEVVAQHDSIPDLEEINPEFCYTTWDIVLTTDKDIDTIRDVFIFIDDSSDIRIDIINSLNGHSRPDGILPHKMLGEILIERGDITEQQLKSVLDEKKLLGKMLVEKGIIASEKVESALIEQQHVKQQREKSQAKDEGIASIRVPASKLDILVNLVGELVTVQARLSQTASSSGDSNVLSVAEEVERLTAELRDNTLNIRMLPIGNTFNRFKRLIRDLSQELGKEIEMVTQGEETELDKTVIERLSDPLVHIIRNCIDHGIESPDVRVAAGKERTGHVSLSAIHSGAHVIIEITDDGKGLDRDAILVKAIEKGLVTPNSDISDKEILHLIFAPGFSTAASVTNVSGRGVGMDAAKKAIDSLGATIEVSSEKGKGTSVTIKLPLTLAIVEGLLVHIGDDHFVLPLSIVEECVELTRDDIHRSNGRHIAYIRGEIVPYISLRQEFAITGNPPDIEQIVITGVNGSRIGFVVDSVIGEHQTVIKSLGRCYKDVDTISGATVLGNGNVALIIDAVKLAKNVESREMIHAA
jgi:two-component system, chemotaxis family, sensor kinase CheA